MKIVKMRANHVETPLGYELSDLTLSWKVEEAEGKKTRSAQVRIYADAQRKNLLHDSAASGREKIDSLGYCPGIELQPEPAITGVWRWRRIPDAGQRAFPGLKQVKCRSLGRLLGFPPAGGSILF